MFLVNVNETPDVRIEEIINMAITQASTQWAPAKFEGQFPRNGFGITALRPCHVGEPLSDVDSWLCSVTAGSTYTFINWFDVVVNEDCYLIVTGLFNLTPNPKVTELYIKANGEDLPIINLEEMYAYDVSRVFLTAPFIVKPKSGFQIQVYATAATQERLGLVGYCLAKRAYLINKASTTG